MPTKPGGKNGTKYLTIDDMWEIFCQYKITVKQNPFIVKDWVGGAGKEVKRLKEKPLTWEGFQNYVTDKTGLCNLNDYEFNSNGRYDDYKNVVARIKSVIRQDQIEGGMAQIYNPSITQRLNNLVEKTENKHDVNEITIKYE
jgi:hypothetical protein